MKTDIETSIFSEISDSSSEEIFWAEKKKHFFLSEESESITNSFDLSVQIQIWHQRLFEEIQDTIMC